MEFYRSDRKSKQIFYLLLTLTGLTSIYFGWQNLHGFWAFILIIVLGLLSYGWYKKFRASKREIYSIKLEEAKVIFEFLNGEQEEISKDELEFSLLAKKYIQPIRAIAFIHKKKRRFAKKRLLGKVSHKKWPKIKELATLLVQRDFERSRWKFGSNGGSILLLFAMILGDIHEDAEIFSSDIEAYNLKVSAESLADDIDRKRDESEKEQEKFAKKNKPDK